MKKLNNKSVVTSVIIALVLSLIGPPMAYAVEEPVDLLSADNFVILSKTGVTNVPTSAITGNIGTSPITGASITELDCVQVTGIIYTIDATGPACRTTDATLLGTVVSDMEAAYTNAAGRAAGVGAFLNVGAGTVTGRTLVPGTYTWGSNVSIPTNLILDAQGDANAVWIFQIAGMLNIAAEKQVILSGSAQARNIFWQVASTVTLGAGSHFEGTILAQTNIAMITGATLTGRALAQTAVTLQSNTITDPMSALADVTLLTAAKATAQVLITANAPESMVPGEHVAGSLATLTSANTAANATTASAQSVVDAQVVTLNAAIAQYNAALIAASDVTLLTAAKATAQGLITANAPESTTPGNHVAGSLATLTSANTAANATTASAQSVVDAQVVTLNAAIAQYNAAIVPPNNAVIILQPPAKIFAPAPLPLNLLAAGSFVILSKTGITNVPTSAITGNIGTSPITGASIAGLDCVEITGTIYTVDATGPACRTTDATLLGTAVSDMEAAYTNVAGRPAGVGAFLNVGAGTITNRILVPGTYTWSSNVTIPTHLILDAKGDANAAWLFQIAGILDVAAGKQVILSGDAQARNVYWQVAGAVTLGAGSHFEGTILAQTSIAMLTGATLTGRALAQTMVTLQSNTVSIATPVSTPPAILYPTISARTPSGSKRIEAKSGSGEIALQPVVTSVPLLGSIDDRRVLSVVPPRKLIKNLVQGASGDDVRELQKHLLADGVYRSDITGYFGPATKKALRLYQSKNKLPSTGFFGPKTRALINA